MMGVSGALALGLEGRHAAFEASVFFLKIARELLVFRENKPPSKQANRAMGLWPWLVDSDSELGMDLAPKGF